VDAVESTVARYYFVIVFSAWLARGFYRYVDNFNTWTVPREKLLHVLCCCFNSILWSSKLFNIETVYRTEMELFLLNLVMLC